jgi:predicted phosphodiesterase
MDVEKVVFLSDIHVPHHDRVVWPQVLKFIELYQPDRVVLNGDIIDAYPISSFSKDPLRADTLQDEFDITRNEIIAPIRAMLPHAQLDFTPGNHEDRLQRYLRSQAPGLASLRCLDLEQLLGADEFGMTVHPQPGFLLRPHFRVYHGTVVRKHSGWSAKGELEKWGWATSGISGHTHRMDAFHFDTGREPVGWFEQGCLCEPKPEYIVGTPNWRQGFAVGEFERGGDWFDIQLVKIIHGKLRVNRIDFSQLV